MAILEPKYSVSYDAPVRAWESLSASQQRPPRKVQLITPTPEKLTGLRLKSYVFRLAGAGDRGTDVIAKLATPEAGARERWVYERLPGLVDLALPAYYGAVPWPPARPTGVWLFLEDLGRDRPFDAERAHHRRLMAAWLGELHAATRSLPADAPLERRDMPAYRRSLRGAIDRLQGAREEAGHGARDAETLDVVQRLCRELQRRWPALEAVTAPLPMALVHGDLKRLNLRVRHTPQGPALLAFDWELAAWGVVAADLAAPKIRWTPRAIAAYLAASDGVGRARTDEAAFARVAAAGYLLRHIDALHWALDMLPFAPSYTFPTLRAYRPRMQAALARLDGG